MERIDSDKVAPKMEDISSPIPLIIDYDLGCKFLDTAYRNTARQGWNILLDEPRA